MNARGCLRCLQNTVHSVACSSAQRVPSMAPTHVAVTASIFLTMCLSFLLALPHPLKSLPCPKQTLRRPVLLPMLLQHRLPPSQHQPMPLIMLSHSSGALQISVSLRCLSLHLHPLLTSQHRHLTIHLVFLRPSLFALTRLSSALTQSLLSITFLLTLLPAMWSLARRTYCRGLRPRHCRRLAAYAYCNDSSTSRRSGLQWMPQRTVISCLWRAGLTMRRLA
mmetsp:Transcript_32398/g.52413  ORF Transcript_32398/g.52413 Transcript_32398/m.52413 type:complete len:222 (+) Transcript_32398:373-1038(+)